MAEDKLIRREYRISSWRHDVIRSTYKTFFTEGESVEECDQKADKEFDKVSNDQRNSWDGMDMVRIDVPAVAEKTTFLKKNGRQENND